MYKLQINLVIMLQSLSSAIYDINKIGIIASALILLGSSHLANQNIADFYGSETSLPT